MSIMSFERYDDEFTSLSQQVKESLQGDIHNVKFAPSLLKQCDDLLKQMAVEARGVEDASSKRNLLSKVKTCKTQLQQLKEQHHQVSSKMDRDTLGLAEADSNVSIGNNNNNNRNAHKERLLQTDKTLTQQNDTLENARRIMADTEEVALEITSELGRNRETMESASGRVREVSGLTNRARRILHSMSRRQVQQKLAMYVIAGIICVVFLAILWNLR